MSYASQKGVLASPASTIPNNLPLQLTSFVGREREIAEVRQLLRVSRLLTLTGAGGSGKTRLALQLATDLLDEPGEFEHGVYFVSLAPISDLDLVISAIAQAIDVRESPGHALEESLKAYLHDRHLLLILDNFEQITEAASQVVDLLRAAPEVKVLVTSRASLQISGEQQYAVQPLALPDPRMLPSLEELSEVEAVDLFVQRATSVRPQFTLTRENAQAIAEICHGLDGLPLAVELAAARILVLPPEELQARLDSRLKLLTGGARNLPERQRTLQATIDWSYNLLDPAEQTLFRRLGIFVGGGTLDAIEKVCGRNLEVDALDGVTSLVSKSLLSVSKGFQQQEGVAGEPRFTMLETIREYARERLEESGEVEAITDRHCDYFLQYAEDANKGIFAATALSLRLLDAEQNNLRAVLEWSLSADGGAEMGLKMTGALMRYWFNRGYLSEGRQWCTQLLNKTEQEGATVERATALRTLARMIFEQGEYAEARETYERSLDISRALGDEMGVATTLPGLGSVAIWQGEYDFCQSLYEEVLAIGRQLGDKFSIANALSMLGTVHMLKEEYEAAQSWYEEALAIDREWGNEAGVAQTLTGLGSVVFNRGDHEKAKALIEESLGMAQELGVEWVIASCRGRLGMVALAQSDRQGAQTYFLEGLERAQSTGNRRWSQWNLVGLAEVARLRGMPDRAAKLIGVSEGVLSAAGGHYEPGIHREIERIVPGVQAEQDEDTFARLYGEGRAMSFEDAMDYALEPTSAPPDPLTGEKTTIAHQRAYPDDLTEREVEVLRLIAAGKSNQEIAQELVLSLRTVERHITNIYQKIGATGRVARATAATYALRHGLAEG